MQNITGKIILITGGSSGIGEAAARRLKLLGAHVVITGSSKRTAAVARALECDHFIVDYRDFGQVTKLAKDILKKYPRIDILINNAGAYFADRALTKDGHESTFQTNFLSPFLLTQLLQKRLEESHATVINTASVAHVLRHIRRDDLENQDYDPFQAYGASKGMNVLHAMALPHQFKNVSAVSFYPGLVKTRFADKGQSRMRYFYHTWLTYLFMISPERGADTLIRLAQGTPEVDRKSCTYYYKRKPEKK